MAKTFAKTFVRLLATIVVKGRRLVPILYLEAKYAKMKSMRKTGKEHLDGKSQPWKKSTVNSPEVEVKVNIEKVNCLRSKSIWR